MNVVLFLFSVPCFFMSDSTALNLNKNATVKTVALQIQIMLIIQLAMYE